MDIAKTEQNALLELVGQGKSKLDPEVPLETKIQRFKIFIKVICIVIISMKSQYFINLRRATLLEKQEERARRENKILSDFRELIHKRESERKKG